MTNGYIGNTKLVLDNATTPGHYLYIDGDCIFGRISGWMYDICVSVQDFGGEIAIAQTATSVFGADPLIYTRSYYYANSPAWTPWVQFATATPPVEYDLPLASGWTSFDDYGDGIKYGVCGDGKVQIKGCLTAPASAIIGQQIGTLPSGFRPVGRRAWVQCVDASTGNSYTVRIQTDGAMFLWGGALPAASAPLVFPSQYFYAD